MVSTTPNAILDAGLSKVIYYLEYLHPECSVAVYMCLVKDLQAVQKNYLDYNLFEYMLNHAHVQNSVSSITEFLNMARDCHITAYQLISIITLARRFSRSVSAFITFHELPIAACEILALHGTPVEISRYFVDNQDKVFSGKVLSILCARYRLEQSNPNIRPLGDLLCAVVPAATLYEDPATFDLLLNNCPKGLRFAIIAEDDIRSELSLWQQTQVERANKIISNQSPDGRRKSQERSKLIRFIP